MKVVQLGLGRDLCVLACNLELASMMLCFEKEGVLGMCKGHTVSSHTHTDSSSDQLCQAGGDDEPARADSGQAGGEGDWDSQPVREAYDAGAVSARDGCEGEAGVCGAYTSRTTAGLTRCRSSSPLSSLQHCCCSLPFWTRSLAGREPHNHAGRHFKLLSVGLPAMPVLKRGMSRPHFSSIGEVSR